MNAVELERTGSELGTQPLDRAEFAFQLIDDFGKSATTLKRVCAEGSNASDVAHDPSHHNNIHLATCAIDEVETNLQTDCELPDVFEGGFSVRNNRTIHAAAARLPNNLIGKDTLIRTGERHYVCYQLAVAIMNSQDAN
tara:strand:+ start:2591 stop:3007 length:417 start_codon:yes stop_codon:yes gene_type:complete